MGKWAVALAALLAPAAGAEPYAVGSALPPLTLPDQHGQSRELDEQLRLVLFSREMGGGGATLLFVEQLRIVRIEHVDSAEALRDAVEPAAPAGESGSGD